MKRYRSDSEYHGIEIDENGEYYRRVDVIEELNKKNELINDLSSVLNSIQFWNTELSDVHKEWIKEIFNRISDENRQREMEEDA